MSNFPSRRLLLWPALLICVASAGCPAQRRPTGTIVIHGEVLDAETGKAVARARLQIEILLATTRLARYGITDGRGRFSLPMRLPARIRSDPNLPYRLSVAAEGFKPYVGTLKMKELPGRGSSCTWPTVRLARKKRAPEIPWKP
jgi:hypothetical protein